MGHPFPDAGEGTGRRMRTGPIRFDPVDAAAMAQQCTDIPARADRGYAVVHAGAAYVGVAAPAAAVPSSPASASSGASATPVATMAEPRPPGRTRSNSTLTTSIPHKSGRCHDRLAPDPVRPTPVTGRIDPVAVTLDLGMTANAAAGSTPVRHRATDVPLVLADYSDSVAGASARTPSPSPSPTRSGPSASTGSTKPAPAATRRRDPRAAKRRRAARQNRMTTEAAKATKTLRDGLLPGGRACTPLRAGPFAGSR